MTIMTCEPSAGVRPRLLKSSRASLRRLPSITRLQAFEAAARLGGFTQAAKALNMTQGAVGYQVRTLEKQLGVELFLRSPRGLVLTSDGDRLAQ